MVERTNKSLDFRCGNPFTKFCYFCVQNGIAKVFLPIPNVGKIDINFC